MQRFPIPPYTADTALAKVRAVENDWNTRDPDIVAHGYSLDCVWRNRKEVFHGREAIKFLVKRKWATASHCQPDQEVWAFTANRISVRLKSEWQHVETGQWFRSHVNEHWEFDADGFITRRDSSANDIPIFAPGRFVGL